MYTIFFHNYLLQSTKTLLRRKTLPSRLLSFVFLYLRPATTLEMFLHSSSRGPFVSDVSPSGCISWPPPGMGVASFDSAYCPRGAWGAGDGWPLRGRACPLTERRRPCAEVLQVSLLVDPGYPLPEGKYMHQNYVWTVFIQGGGIARGTKSHWVRLLIPKYSFSVMCFASGFMPCTITSLFWGHFKPDSMVISFLTGNAAPSLDLNWAISCAKHTEKNPGLRVSLHRKLNCLKKKQRSNKKHWFFRALKSIAKPRLAIHLPAGSEYLISGQRQALGLGPMGSITASIAVSPQAEGLRTNQTSF